MSTQTGVLARRVDVAPTTLLVAVGDLFFIGLFVLLGELSHGVEPLSQPLLVLDTYVPFLIGWLLTSILGGMYTRDAWRTPKRAVSLTLPAWIGADLVAQSLRATSLFHGDAAVTFFLVAAAVGGFFLTGWRVAVAWATG
ncbi:DUF3054 domain-containing protein [Haloarculaceae archaeon H-GB11]|nr:DUF3054 domain-containing protein [Haloarculaceae archaeon H-GB11]